MNKYQKLVSNSLIFAIGNIGSKMITFLLLPLYTYTLSTQDYGTADLVQTTVTLLVPIISLNIFEGVLRFAMDRNENKIDVLNVGFTLSVFGSLVFLAIGIVGMLFGIKNIMFMMAIVVVQSFQSLFSQYVKAIGKVSVFAVNGVLLTLITVIFDVLFLVLFSFGLNGYFWALILATICSNVYLMYRGEFVPDLSMKIDNELAKRMTKFSVPLIPNSVAWWATSAISRYFILYFVGAAANGIFAVANKIPALLSVVNSIFFQSWQISAIEEFDSDNKKEFYSNVFSMYSKMMLLGTSAVLLILKPLMMLIVSHAFYSAWKYIPFLLLSVVYSSFSSFLGQYYIAAKKTDGILTTTIYGTILNIILNFILIPKIQLFGAAVSAMVSYFVIWMMRARGVQKFVESDFDFKGLLINHIVIFAQIFFLFSQSGALLYGIESLLLLASISVNYSIVKLLVNGMLQLIKRKM